MTNNTITSPKGFKAAGIACGVKQSKKKDIAVLVCPVGATAAAVFTTNQITAAPVQISKKHIKSQSIYGVIANSGCANACTSDKGLKDAIVMCTQTAKLFDTNPHNILVASTGIIGEHLPMKKIAAGIKKAAAKLSNSAQAGLDFAKAIMTTDTKPKLAVKRLEISGKKITIAGAVKGAGMIAPNMATTLLFITTDVAITRPLLHSALKKAIDNSLNKLTIDGHQSTNDTAIILSSGCAGNRPIKSPCPRYKKFAKALRDLCDDLARQIALDAEGATRMFKVIVQGAASVAEASKAARAIADYPLVKCAVNGGDPNWGRIICAIGSCGVKLDPNKLSCKLDDVTVFKSGEPNKFDVKKASRIVSSRVHTMTVNLGVGKASDFCYGCDLSKGYVTINADYHT
ncbi:MAG: bifunctional glutamate N-acetyltransferase/amino-acid acetyltransferase ArgJ [Planctomycetota bacterium]|jgi:glutamate N-acetyltransferase/amino-acid N-acetyltransferase